MQGFVTRDRRKAHVREADAEAAAHFTEESEGEDAEGGEPSGGADPPGGTLLDNLQRDAGQFGAVVRTLRVLLRAGQAAEAAALTQHVLQLVAKRWVDRWGHVCMSDRHNMHAVAGVRRISCSCSCEVHVVSSIVLGFGSTPQLQNVQLVYGRPASAQGRVTRGWSVRPRAIALTSDNPLH